jgi:predicted RNA-binding protein
MCEFKIVKKNDGSQILEDIVVLTYTENNELLFKDILGVGETLDSALILEVNTLNQKCVVIEHPLIREFLDLILDINGKKINTSKIEEFKSKLDSFIT